MKRLTLLFCATFIFCMANAQTPAADSIPFKRFTLSDFSLGLSFFSGRVNTNGFNDAEFISGHPSAIPQDSGSHFSTYYDEYSHLTGSVHFKINSKKKSKFHHYIGAGLAYSRSNGFSLYKSTYYQQTIDTLASNTSPYYALIDTFSDRSQYSQLYTNNIALNLSYRVSTNPARRVSGYATANLGIGGAVTSTYSYTDWQRSGLILSQLIDPTDTMSTPGYQHYHGYGIENNGSVSGTGYAAAKPFVLRPYLAAGINFRLSRKMSVLRHISLNLEYRWGGQILFFGNRTYSGLSSGMSIGVRYTMDGFKKAKS